MEFLTVRQFVCKYKFLSESTVRSLIKEGKVPGFYVGNRFLINSEDFIEFLKNARPESK